MQQPRRSAGLLQVWGWYCDLSEVRGNSRLTEPVRMPNGALGWQVKAMALRLTRSEIQSWCYLNSVQLEGWQLAAIEMIDEKHVNLINNPLPPSDPVKPTGKDKSGWLALFTAMGVRKDT